MTEIVKICDIPTKWCGIALEKWTDGYYLYSSNGNEQMYQNQPTDEQIEKFVDECTIF